MSSAWCLEVVLGRCRYFFKQKQSFSFCKPFFWNYRAKLNLIWPINDFYSIDLPSIMIAIIMIKSLYTCNFIAFMNWNVQNYGQRSTTEQCFAVKREIIISMRENNGIKNMFIRNTQDIWPFYKYFTLHCFIFFQI